MPTPSPPAKPTAVSAAAPIFAEGLHGGKTYAPAQAAGGSLTNASGGDGGSSEANSRAASTAALSVSNYNPVFVSTTTNTAADSRSSQVQEGDTRPALFGSNNVERWLKENEKDFFKLVHFTWQREEQFNASYQLIEKENQRLLQQNKSLKVDQFYINAYDANVERVKAIATQIGGSAVDEFQAGLDHIQQAYRKERADKANAATIMASYLEGKIASLEMDVQKLQNRNSVLEKENQNFKIENEQLQRSLESQEANCSPEIEPEWIIPDPDEEEQRLDEELRDINDELNYHKQHKVELENELHEATPKLEKLEENLKDIPESKHWELKGARGKVEAAQTSVSKLKADIKESIERHDNLGTDKQAKELRRDQLRDERMSKRTRNASVSSTDSGSRSRGTGFSSLSRKTSSTDATALTTIDESSEPPSASQLKPG